MGILILTLILLLCSALASKIWRVEKLTTCLSSLALVAALFPTGLVLWNGQALQFSFPWELFQNTVVLKLDALGAFFLLPILILSLAATIYGPAYLKQHVAPEKIKSIWSFYFLLLFSMISVVLAHNIIFFLLVWELMSLTSFFLVIHQSENESSRKAGWLYLSLTQIGTAFIIIFFLLLSKNAASFDFSSIDSNLIDPKTATLCFFFALIGFGTKAGIMPLHIWLPEAHPAAPSHVSALMSGVMIKTGIYGIIRSLTLLPNAQYSWGITLIVVGAITGIVSVLFAIVQKDIKRLLAYCSVKNIGIIILALGLGVLGLSQNLPVLALLGFSGALLHVLNHAIFKGLLFLSAGSLIARLHSQNMEVMGGLAKFMPITALGFLIGSLSICALPPFNGFVSEFMIYLGSFKALQIGQSWNNLPFIMSILSLALIGGLAVICFTKAFGMIFLGAPRTKFHHEIKEQTTSIILPQMGLSLLCLLIGLFPVVAFRLLYHPLHFIVQQKVELSSLNSQLDFLNPMSWMSFIFIAIVLVLIFVRRSLTQKRQYEQTETWGCGYTKPTARIQYTGSSFVQMITDHFDFILRTKKAAPKITSLFPEKETFHTEVSDSVSESFYKPFYHFLEKNLYRLTRLQHGLLNVYILYIVLTLILLLAFQLD